MTRWTLNVHKISKLILHLRQHVVL